jgi:pimeloyl-ACP methyl ester carboxylesterase
MMPSAFALEAGGLVLHGLRHTAPGRRKVLALHGWLDNAASFLPLLPYLPELDLVLLDLPGHGLSDHLPDGVPYTGAGALNQILAFADALGWERFTLLGHSMGAGIASHLAAVAPERVEALIAIEGLGGLAGTAESTTQRLRDHLAEMKRQPRTSLRVFPDLLVPIRARMRINQLDETNARLLVERGVRSVDGGYCWRSDPRLTLTTPVRMTEAQIQDLLRHIACPSLVLFAMPAPVYFPESVRQQRAALLPKALLDHLPGSHHLHMEQPQEVAQRIARFLSALPANS